LVSISVVDWGNSSVGLVGASWGTGSNDGGGWNGVLSNNWALDDLSVVLSVDLSVSLSVGGWDSLGLVGQFLSVGLLDGLNNSGSSDLGVDLGNWRVNLSSWRVNVGSWRVNLGSWRVNLGVDGRLDSISLTFNNVVGEVSSVSLAVDDSRVLGWDSVDNMSAGNSDEGNENSDGLHGDC
jgi:hypothetical protein